MEYVPQVLVIGCITVAGIMNHTQTKMGYRMLKASVLQPLTSECRLPVLTVLKLKAALSVQTKISSTTVWM